MPDLKNTTHAHNQYTITNSQRFVVWDYMSYYGLRVHVHQLKQSWLDEVKCYYVSSLEMALAEDQPMEK